MTKMISIYLLFLLVPWNPLTVTGRVILSMLLGILLVFRPYRFLPELGSGRRALTWLGSLALITGFIMARGPAEASSGVGQVLHHVLGLARFVLVIFWAMNIVWIFLGVRLVRRGRSWPFSDFNAAFLSLGSSHVNNVSNSSFFIFKYLRSIYR